HPARGHAGAGDEDVVLGTAHVLRRAGRRARRAGTDAVRCSDGGRSFAHRLLAPGACTVHTNYGTRVQGVLEHDRRRSVMVQFTWSRYGGYEVSSKGDARFSAFNARMPDGRSIE